MLAWKNGLGVSHVVASHPDGASYDALIWQASTTSIAASCSFSSLPGLDRQFTVLEGEGVELHCRGLNGAPDFRRRIGVPLEPFEFRGDWQTECRLLGGPVQVFNVLTRRGCCSARVTVSTVQKPIALEKAAGEALLVFVAVGAVEIEGRSDAIGTNDAMLADGARSGRYFIRRGPARLVIARIPPVRVAAGQ